LPLVWFAGCNVPTGSNETDRPAGEAWEAATDLTSEYGGYQFADEKPAFGDAEITKIEAEESPLVVDDPDSMDMHGCFALRILWGQLRGNPEAEQVTDWSGMISVTSGGLAVLRTIAFEVPYDHLLRRENRQEVGFVSHTQPHFDGLLLLVRDPGDPAAILRFETAPFTGAWTFQELREIDTVIPVDELGNAVSLEGIAIDFDPACPNGAVRGHWVQRDGERGVFRGLWVTALGRPVGHIRGHFGVNPEGARVWFGKIIDRDGRVIGLARGAWQPSEDPERPGGTFAGHWVAREGALRGTVAGHYLPAREWESGVGGFFQGRWRTDCDAPEPQPEPATP
jgi:hypothetical protein